MSRMIRAAAIAVALAAAHCGGAPDEDPSTSTSVPEQVAPPSAPRPAAAPPEEEPPAPSGPSHPPVVDVALGANATRVTSYTVDDANNVYVAGAFTGTMTMGMVRVTSRGLSDVFLAKIAPDAHVAWAVAVGSPMRESGPRVALRDGGSVSLVGLTAGRLDCGAGPLPSWGDDAFFVCVFGDGDGALRSGGVFPTGSPS